MKKGIILVLAMVMAVCIGVGATLAYLFVETAPVTNTFTYGDINITLTETTGNNYKMVPGNTIAKNPKVTVKEDSEACWLFVKIEESGNFKNFMTYEIADGWTALPGETNVYYREVPATEADTEFEVLKGNEVLVKATVLKTELNALTEGTMPTLTFTAYAVQKANVTSVADAWELVGTKGTPANS